MGKQEELVKIGLEGFAILDELYGRNKKKPVPPPPPPRHQEFQHQQQRPVFRSMVHSTKDPVICRYRGAQSYEVVVIKETSHRSFNIYGK